MSPRQAEKLVQHVDALIVKHPDLSSNPELLRDLIALREQLHSHRRRRDWKQFAVDALRVATFIKFIHDHYDDWLG